MLIFVFKVIRRSIRQHRLQGIFFRYQRIFQNCAKEEAEHQSRLSDLLQRRIQNLVKHLRWSFHVILVLIVHYFRTPQKIFFSIKDFFSKCYQIRSLLINFIYLCSIAKSSIFHVLLGSGDAPVVLLLLTLKKDVLKDHTY